MSDIWLHVKTHKLYRFVASGKLENDATAVVVYQSVDTGDIWVRPLLEFCDGRFVQQQKV